MAELKPCAHESVFQLAKIALSEEKTLSDLASQAAASGHTHGVLLVCAGDDTTRRLRSKRMHDIKGALRTLHLALESLRKGYRFDDTSAEAKIEAMARAFTHLERESHLSLAILQE